MDACNLIESQRAWIKAFDNAVDTDDWQSLERWVTDDVRYVVSGTPFATSLTGREAVLNGLRRSINNFDNRFDRRIWLPVGTRLRETNTVEVRVWSRYEKAGLPPLTFPALSRFTFRGELIELMTDTYEGDLVELQEAYAWLAERPGEYDPSYV